MSGDGGSVSVLGCSKGKDGGLRWHMKQSDSMEEEAVAICVESHVSGRLGSGTPALLKVTSSYLGTIGHFQ